MNAHAAHGVKKDILVKAGNARMTVQNRQKHGQALRVETHTAVAEMRAMVAEANGEIARVDSLLDTAEVVGARVEATSRLAWLVMRTPLVKLASASVASDRRLRGAIAAESVEVIEPRSLGDGSVTNRRRRGRAARRAS